MAEIKRRNRDTESSDNDPSGNEPPRRQTRVTLTKDVSSKYRKILPKAQSSRGSSGRRPASGSPDSGRPASRRPDSGKPGPRPKTFEKRGEGFPAPNRSRPAGGGRGTPFKKDGERSPGGFAGAGGFRKAPSKAPAGRFGSGFNGLELAAIKGRKLPEASSHIKETQELIESSATDILTLLEKLVESHRSLSAAIEEASGRHGSLLEPVLSPLRTELETVNKTLVILFEKMSFHDLAGQRLNSVESFLKTLSQVMESKSSPYGAKDRPTGHRRGPGDKPFKPRGKPERRSGELKGPQSRGRALGQRDVDRMVDK